MAGTAYMSGMSVCIGGVIVAFLDLKGVTAGRVDTDGRAKVVCGGVVSGFALVLYWASAVFALVRLF